MFYEINRYWGPIGIQLGIGNQEVSHNRIENMYAAGGAFVADGGAIEIDDGRNHKDNINIHHNRTYHKNPKYICFFKFPSNTYANCGSRFVLIRSTEFFGSILLFH